MKTRQELLHSVRVSLCMNAAGEVRDSGKAQCYSEVDTTGDNLVGVTGINGICAAVIREAVITKVKTLKGASSQSLGHLCRGTVMDIWPCRERMSIEKGFK